MTSMLLIRDRFRVLVSKNQQPSSLTKNYILNLIQHVSVPYSQSGGLLIPPNDARKYNYNISAYSRETVQFCKHYRIHILTFIINIYMYVCMFSPVSRPILTSKYCHLHYPPHNTHPFTAKAEEHETLGEGRWFSRMFSQSNCSQPSLSSNHY